MTRFAAVLAAVELACVAGAQLAPVPTIRVETRIVPVDVVVTDRQGKLVKNLQAADFAVAENGAPQTISHFEVHTSLSAEELAKLPPMPKLDANIFTNYSTVPNNSSLNVLLLDEMNTKLAPKTVVLNQVLKYLATPHPGARMEIFELEPEGGLRLIQGFTSDPEVLRTALMNRKIVPASSVVDDELRRCGVAQTSADGFDAPVVSVDAGSSGSGPGECLAMQLKVRSLTTLEGMAALARYMGGLPGRKNLLWFSSSFTLPPGKRDVSDKLHETMALFARSQVAVYPIVAGGVILPPPPPPPTSGQRDPTLGQQLAASNRTDNEEQTMQRMAEDTGGKVFSRTNDLAGAAGEAIDNGSNYYTLTYSPTNRDWNGDFRKVQVKLAQKGFRLAYRPGYYAEDIDERSPKTVMVAGVDYVAGEGAGPAKAALHSAALALHSAAVALHSAMEFGSPQPSDIVFKAAINAATGKLEDVAARGNSLSPKVSAPFERYVISLAALPTAFTFTRTAAGKIHMGAQLVTCVYAADGARINATSIKINEDIDTARYESIMANGMKFQQEISVPVKGESFLRIGVEDLATSKVGVVEIPVATVAKLKPLSAAVDPP